MKKLLSFNCIKSNTILKGMKLFFLFLFFISFVNVNAQNLISRNPVDYPGGSVPTTPIPCVDYTDLNDNDCIIYLPPATVGDPYNFTIPLKGVLTFADIDVVACDKNGGCISGAFDCITGTIDMPANAICISDGGESYIEFEIEVEDGLGEEDAQKFRIPVIVPRTPVKVVLVLDRSGSMGWTVPGGTAIRWEVLKKSVWEFVSQLELHQQNKDSLGLTYFMSNVIQPGIPILDGFDSIPPDNAIELISDTVNYLMNLQTPQGGTAMGLGLQDAIIKLEGNTPIGATKIVLLFTDGQQNRYPEVLSDGMQLEDNSFLNYPTLNPEDSIRYYTIGMGSLGLVPAILSEIAAKNSGVFLYTTTGDHIDFEVFFDNQFTDMLSSGSPQIVKRQVGKLINGTGSHTFLLNEGITQAIFKVSHKEGDNININIEKNAIDYTPENIITSSFLKMTKIEFPIINDTVINSGGEWTVSVTGNSTEEYYVTCIADDHFLDYSCEADKNIYITGEYIDFTVDLSYGGIPLTGANDSVEVFIFKPGDDLGNMLATYSVPDDVIDYTNNDISPEDQKLQSLMNDPDFYNKLLPDEQSIELQHQGNGIFTGRFNSTSISGVYQALFRMKGNIPTRGNFEREKLFSIVVENGGFVNASIDKINDIIPPSDPSDLNSPIATHTSVDLDWNASMDNVLLKNYTIYKNGVLIDTTNTITYKAIDLDVSTEYSFYVMAMDIANNYSGQSNEVVVTTNETPDTIAPSAPLELVASNITQSNLYLSWNASTDNLFVTEYTIYQDNEPVATTENISYSITNLAPGTNYTFNVTAKDEASNESGQSSDHNVSTLDLPPVLTAPTKLTIQDISQTKISLNWNASTGNVGYLQYEIYQNGALIGTTSNVNYNVLNLNLSTVYTYHVISKDSENNVSDASNSVTGVTLEEVADISNSYSILEIKPKNKFGYYLGPGFKRKIKFKYVPKGSRKAIAQKTSMQDQPIEQGNDPEPYLKEIKDNLDGSYYLIIANVLPKTNPNIIVTIGDEVYYDGPINDKLPIWLYILIILILIILILLKLTKSDKKALKLLLWILLIILLIIYYLHTTGFLNFL